MTHRVNQLAEANSPTMPKDLPHGALVVNMRPPRWRRLRPFYAVSSSSRRFRI